MRGCALGGFGPGETERERTPPRRAKRLGKSRGSRSWKLQDRPTRRRRFDRILQTRWTQTRHRRVVVVVVVQRLRHPPRRLVFIAETSARARESGNTSRTGHIFAGYVYYLRKGGLLEKRSAERSLGKLVAAALPLIYGNRRDSYGKVTAASSIKRRAACPRGNPRRTNRKSRNRNCSSRGRRARAELGCEPFPSSREFRVTFDNAGSPTPFSRRGGCIISLSFLDGRGTARSFLLASAISQIHGIYLSFIYSVPEAFVFHRISILSQHPRDDSRGIPRTHALEIPE